jgi:hypothetical protein
MAVLGKDDRLRDAHVTAVFEALEETERYSGSRVRQKGANEDRITGNMVIAVYQHDTSRELDPQLHTHAVAANLTYDGAEGRWKALQAGGIYERRAFISEVYRNALAREVLRLGYGIESQRDSRGRDCGFEIAGLPGELLRRFSQRSRQRDEATREFERARGRLPTDNEIAVLVRESRPAIRKRYATRWGARLRESRPPNWPERPAPSCKGGFSAAWQQHATWSGVPAIGRCRPWKRKSGGNPEWSVSVRSASVASEVAWQVNERGAHALEVVLHKATYVLPWSQFLYAEGGEDEVRLVFATHDVMVKGSGLAALLTDVAAHRLAAVTEPLSADRFLGRGMSCVRELAVRRVGQGEE